MLIGGHVSAAGELGLTVDRAKAIGANTFQFFISPPQQWLHTKHSDQEIADFGQKIQQQGIGPTFIHGTYLINLATNKSEHLERSINWLKYAMHTAHKLGVTGVIFHTGSHSGRGFESVVDQIAEALKTILAQSDQNDKQVPYLILENSAGGGGSIGSKFSELGKILNQVQDERLKICLDTCHAYTAGYDIKTRIGLKSTLEEFDQEIGIKNLAAIHANDCKFELGSHKDRHENIGEGFIGKEGFENLINYPALQNIPFILEVPGFGEAGPDAENISILQNLVSK